MYDKEEEEGREALLVPMMLALVECRECNGQDSTGVITDQTQDVLIIPVIQRPLGNLKKA